MRRVEIEETDRGQAGAKTVRQTVFYAVGVSRTGHHEKELLLSQELFLL